VNAAPFSIRIVAGKRPIVSIDDFYVAWDGITFLFGESGIGKSMICKALYGLLDPDELDVTMGGTAYRMFLDSPASRDIRQNSFFVFQEPSSHLDPLSRIDGQLREGSLKGAGNEEEVLNQLWQGSDLTKIQRILKLYPKPYRPSGGEKQRLLLAMAFKKIEAFQQAAPQGAPTFFVFDEPTGSLDNAYRNRFLDMLFTHYRRRQFTAVVITHDYSIISEVRRRYADLTPRIHYRELERTGDATVRLDDFSPDDYLNWLSGARGAAARAESDDRVLTVEPSFSVFGRKHTLFRDAGRTTPAPLVIRRGEMAYVKAPSGVGKTTLAKMVMGLYPADAAAMELCGMKLSNKTPGRVWPDRIWGKRAAMVFQHADESLNLESTVRQCFMGLPLKRTLDDAALRQVLSEVFDGDLPGAFLSKRVKYLSGGQKQRLNLLRSLTLNTDLLILDEPLNGLDFRSVTKVISILEQRRRAGAALLMISHNEEIFDAVVGPQSVYYLN